MKNNKSKLYLAWGILLLILAIMFIGTMLVYEDNNKNVGMTCVVIDKGTIESELCDEQDLCDTENCLIEGSELSEYGYTELFENTKYGVLPKISPDGKCVVDQFAADVKEVNCNIEKRVALVVNVSSAVIKEFVQHISEIRNVYTFVIQSFCEDTPQCVKMLRKRGNEYFLGLSIQLTNDTNLVGPYTILKDGNESDNVDKLLATLGYCREFIGVANVVCNEFFTKSYCFEHILEELGKRGVGFFSFINDEIKDNYKIFETDKVKLFSPSLHIKSDVTNDQLKHIKNLIQSSKYTTILYDYQDIVKLKKFTENLRNQDICIVPITTMVKCEKKSV